MGSNSELIQENVCRQQPDREWANSVGFRWQWADRGLQPIRPRWALPHAVLHPWGSHALRSWAAGLRIKRHFWHDPFLFQIGMHWETRAPISGWPLQSLSGFSGSQTASVPPRSSPGSPTPSESSQCCLENKEVLHKLLLIGLSLFSSRRHLSSCLEDVWTSTF